MIIVTLCIEPVISYDKFIDVMGLIENYFICIFININKNVENREKTKEKTTSTARFWISYKIYLVSLKPILVVASVVRWTTSMP